MGKQIRFLMDIILFEGDNLSPIQIHEKAETSRNH